MTTSPVTPDDLVKIALLAMLHDASGLTGTIEEVDFADSARFQHLEGCSEVTVGVTHCEQDATSTGTGFEVLYARLECPHSDSIIVKTASYGIGSLLGKMIELGESLSDADD